MIHERESLAHVRPVLAPNDRFAIVGKTGSGKTTAAVELLDALISASSDQWLAQILWSKTDPKDVKLFRRFGFVKSTQLGKGGRKVYIEIRPDSRLSVSDKIQLAIRRAIRRVKKGRQHTITLVDEYTSAIVSTRNPGFWLKELLVRGRGNGAGGIIGNQEPAEVPRTYMTQATHILIFDLFSYLDIQQIRKTFPEYERPRDRYGFWHCWTDGPAIWRYYPSMAAFLGRDAD